jgi:hypothetical protein
MAGLAQSMRPPVSGQLSKLRSCDSKLGLLLLRLTRPNPMKPIPPERREAILALRNGLYPDQIERWRLACEQANDTVSAREAGLQKLQRGDRDRIRHLESELRRKEKALAEAAALLVLQRKARAFWGEEDT